MRKIILILIAITGLAGAVNAQASLRINYITASSIDTVTPTTTHAELYGVNVANVSFLYTFSDSLKINVGVIDTLGQVQVMDISNVGYQTILMSDSITLDSVGVTVNSSYFVDGNNTVVIWPAASGTYTFDSLYFNFVYTSVNEVLAKDINVKISPNPATENLFLGDVENVVKRVRIRNTEGKLILQAKTNTFIYVGDLPGGIYVVEMETGNSIYCRKLIIQR